jgi:hypothetical protein
MIVVTTASDRVWMKWGEFPGLCFIGTSGVSEKRQTFVVTHTRMKAKNKRRPLQAAPPVTSTIHFYG